MTKILEFITELIAWFEIVLSPLLIGLVIGAVIYFSRQDTVGLVLGIIVATLGLIIGVILATRIWKKKGTANFMSRLSATPELDNLNDEKTKK
jgi:FtsH-binding integral membrane protein